MGDFITEPLTHLINVCIEQNISKVFKLSQITTISKKRDLDDARPILMIPVRAKENVNSKNQTKLIL